MTYLPPEWAPQSAILLAWPTRNTDWASQLARVQQVYAKLINIITEYQCVLLVVPDQATQIEAERYLKSYECNLAAVSFAIAPYNDTWLRDTGPITLRDKNKITLLDFQFNGWGNKYYCMQDNALVETLFKQGAFDVYFSQPPEHRMLPWVLEGGSIEVNGTGYLMTTSRCLLNPNREHTQNKQEMNVLLKDVLAVEEILWLDQGYLLGDDTDAHIDTLARFCRADHICYQSCNEKSYAAFGELQAMEQALQNQKSFTLTPLPWPDPCLDKHNQRLPATYANFLITNEVVIVPQYQVVQDEQALECLQNCFPDRRVEGLDCLPLIQQHGSLHCISMQIPAV